MDTTNRLGTVMLGLDEAIAFDIENTADWRRRKAVDFPDDQRNLEAAEILERLASEIRGLEGSKLHERLIAVLEKDDNGSSSNVLSEMTRSVGFRSFPSSGEHFVRN